MIIPCLPARLRIAALIPLLVLIADFNSVRAGDGQLRIAADEIELRSWLENMVWHHRYAPEEISQVTGLDELAAENYA
jgi:hypothetical protein